MPKTVVAGTVEQDGQPEEYIKYFEDWAFCSNADIEPEGTF